MIDLTLIKNRAKIHNEQKKTKRRGITTIIALIIGILYIAMKYLF